MNHNDHEPSDERAAGRLSSALRRAMQSAIAEGMAQRLAGGGKPMTPQHTKVKRGGAKRNRRGPA